MPRSSDKLARQQELAWIGDAVLALWARRWILDHPEQNGDGHPADTFARMTSNHFLASIGEPTAVEARIGHIYQKDGEAAAFAWMDETLLPLFLKQQANQQKQTLRRKKHGRR